MITKQELDEWFTYEPDTGIFRWRKRSEKSHHCIIGSIAGSIQNNRRILWMKGRRIYASRAAYIMTHGSIPENALLDHIDGDTRNDRISNLRLASSVQNVWNSLRGEAPGVSRDERGLFKARIQLQTGKKLNLGTWGSAAEAHAAYMGAAAVLHGDFWVGHRKTPNGAETVPDEISGVRK